MQMTRTKPDGSWSVVGSSGDVVLWKDIPKELVGAINRLHAYEKTGFSPETIETLVYENKRLCDGILQLNKRVDELRALLRGKSNEG